MAHQQAEVVRPEPFVFRLNLPQPGWLVDCLLGWNADVRHGRIGQGKRHADPLMERKGSGCRYYYYWIGIQTFFKFSLSKLLKDTNPRFYFVIKLLTQAVRGAGVENIKKSSNCMQWQSWCLHGETHRNPVGPLLSPMCYHRRHPRSRFCCVPLFFTALQNMQN